MPFLSMFRLSDFSCIFKGKAIGLPHDFLALKKGSKGGGVIQVCSENIFQHCSGLTQTNSLDISIWMHIGDDAGSASASDQTFKATASVRWRGSPVVETHGVLLEGGAQLRGKSSDDIVCETAHTGARRQMQFARWHIDQSHGRRRTSRFSAVFRLNHTRNNWIMFIRCSRRNWRGNQEISQCLAARWCSLCWKRVHLPRT